LQRDRALAVISLRKCNAAIDALRKEMGTADKPLDMVLGYGGLTCGTDTS
jgi:hypothetical protein